MHIDSSSIVKRLLILFLVLIGLHVARKFLVPIAIGGVFATLFFPLCRWLESKKTPRGMAAFICLIVLLVTVAGIVTLLGWQISTFTSDFSVIKEKAIETFAQIQEYIFNHLGIPTEQQSEILKDQRPSFGNMVEIVAGSLFNILTDLLFVLFYIFGLLYYRIHIKQFILKLTPANDKKEMENLVYSASRVSQQYLVGLTKMIVCLWIMYGIGFSIVGIKSAIFFAVLCGILEIIPYVGNITGTILTVLISSMQGASISVLVGVVVTYGVVQLIQGWILEPIIVGPQVKINSLTTILALIIGELIWGIPGVFLAIPLVAIFKIVCDHIEPLKSYGFLIGEIENKKERKRIGRRPKSEKPI